MGHDPHHADAQHATGQDHANGEHGHDDHGHGGTAKYWWVFAALCFLTTLSFVTMHFFGNTPTIGWTIMIAVSCAKAMLVISFFMHLIWEANWKWVLTIPAAMMSLFLMFMLTPDVGCRTAHYDEQRWLKAPVPESTEAAHATPADEHPVTPTGEHPAKPHLPAHP